MLIHVQLFATSWTVACQGPLSMGFFQAEYWNGLLFPPPGDLPNTGIEPTSPALTGVFFTTEPLFPYPKLRSILNTLILLCIIIYAQQKDIQFLLIYELVNQLK